MRSVALFLLLTLTFVTSANATSPPIVEIDSGSVRGVVLDGTHAFFGIPYAAPPVGDARWKAPEPVAPWSDARESTAFGPACPQPNQPPEGFFDEDCLSLNVWTPALEGNPGLPVMVWIHGGGFNFGSSAQAEYDGRHLAGLGIVVVTINYRLGPLGFLAHPLPAEESAEGVSGNYGLLDQIEALRWVRRNIHAFGGDPRQVTIVGQSAGARSVSLLTISPLAEGLFRGAIAQSGGPIIGSEYLDPVFDGDMESGARMGQVLGTRLGCDQADNELSCLRSKTAQQIVAAADCRTGLFEDGLFFAPVFDGRVLPLDPAAACRDDSVLRVPMIVGSTGNEGTVYLRGEKGLTVAKYKAFLKSRFGPEADAALAVFPAPSDEDVHGAIDRLITVAVNAQPARFMARTTEKAGSKAYLYRFTRRPNTAKANELGTFHGVDLAYLFGLTNDADGYTDQDRELSGRMMAYWVNFIKTGDPNGTGLVHWPEYRADTDESLAFGDDIHVERHIYQSECDFIDRVSRFVSPKALPVAEETMMDPHAAHTGFRFKDPAMDFVFGSLLLGSAGNGGCEIGEAFVTASRIEDGDVAGWQEQWLRIAGLIEARGHTALTGGHVISARNQFLRAGQAYRAALVGMLPDDPRLLETAGRSRSLMRKAGAFMTPKLEYIEIPFEGSVLPGYFRKASTGNNPSRTLIMIGGAETFAEDQYFYIAPQALERGYNFMTVDLPGQGLLPLEGRFFRSDMEAPLKAVVDYALGRPDVDPGRLAVYGISSGGGFVPQAAAHDGRISAVIMNNCVVDAGAGVARMAVATATPEVVTKWSSFKRQTNQAIAWRFGLDMNDLPGLVQANQDFRFDPARVSMPALILVAAGEYENPEIKRQTRLCLDFIPNPHKNLVITPADEGASNHCVMENRSLMSQEVFDWLDEAFAQRKL